MIGGYRWPDGVIDDGRFVVLFFLFDVMISVRYLSWYLFRIENFILALDVRRPQYSPVRTPEYLNLMPPIRDQMEMVGALRILRKYLLLIAHIERIHNQYRNETR